MTHGEKFWQFFSSHLPPNTYICDLYSKAHEPAAAAGMLPDVDSTSLQKENIERKFRKCDYRHCLVYESYYVFTILLIFFFFTGIVRGHQHFKKEVWVSRYLLSEFNSSYIENGNDVVKYSQCGAVLSVLYRKYVTENLTGNLLSSKVSTGIWQNR